MKQNIKAPSHRHFVWFPRKDKHIQYIREVKWNKKNTTATTATKSENKDQNGTEIEPWLKRTKACTVFTVNGYQINLIKAKWAPDFCRARIQTIAFFRLKSSSRQHPKETNKRKSLLSEVGRLSFHLARDVANADMFHHSRAQKKHKKLVYKQKEE